MSEKTKLSLISIFSVLAGLVFSVFSAGILLFGVQHKGKIITNDWQASDEFQISSIKTVEKQAGKDFVILNLADVQMCDLEDIFHFNTIKSEIEFLVKTTNPDLITLTGDQTWSRENMVSLKLLITLLEEFNIPYAPVFGNHDYGADGDFAIASQTFCCTAYENAPHCLFSRGPSNLGGLGNYVINITENGKIFKTLFMLDSGYGTTITTQQIEWLKWNAEGIKKANGGQSPQGACFLHKPLPEFAEAYFKYSRKDSSVTQISPEVHAYYSLSGSRQNGAFEVLKSYGVSDIVCGHQHGNNFTLKYQDVRLTFALKTGELGGFVDCDEVYLNGATTLSFGESTKIENHFVERNQFKI